MIEIENKKVQCPNCPELLSKVTKESDGTNTLIFWFHEYENFCVDVVDEVYITSGSIRSISYLNVLRDMFKVEI